MLIQAAGHGLLRVSRTHPDAVIKPTSAAEADMYRRFDSDPILAPVRPFVPRLVHITVLESLDPAHPTHTHEIEIQNLCLLGNTAAESEESEPSSGEDGAASGLQPHSIPPKPHTQEDGGDELCPLQAPSPHQSRNGTLPSRTLTLPNHIPPALAVTARTEWSDPCVLDIKLGRIRHGPLTERKKVEHILKKDAGTTGPSLALRICGLRHEHRRIERSAASYLLTHHKSDDEGFMRIESMLGEHDTGASAVDDDDEDTTSALCDYATRRSRCATPVAGSTNALRDGAARKPKRRRAALGQRIEWVEGKELGRSIDYEGLVEAIARYCTCVEIQSVAEENVAGGEHAVPHQPEPPAPRQSAHPFKPQPHIPLVKTYRQAAAELRDAMVTSGVLQHYSFASTSVICVHDFHLDLTSPPVTDGDTRNPSAWLDSTRIKFRSQLKLVDFSCSGPLAGGAVYSDDLVGCMDGLRNLVGLFDAVLDRYGCSEGAG